MNRLRISEREKIEQEVIKNLLAAHSALAINGPAIQIIQLSKYLLKLSKKSGDKLINLGLEKDEQSTCEPPNEGQQDINNPRCQKSPIKLEDLPSHSFYLPNQHK